MLALQHILGALALGVGIVLVALGLVLGRVINWWVFIPAGVALVAAGGWLVSR